MFVAIFDDEATVGCPNIWFGGYSLIQQIQSTERS